MRTFVVSLVLIAACGGKKSEDTATGSGSAVTTGSAGSAVTAPKGETPIQLPKGDGTPPKKTTAQLTDPDFKRMGDINHPPFLKRIRNTTGGMDVRFSTPDRPKLGTTVTITKCFTCPPMELDKWKEREPELKQLLGDALRNRPDTQWELGSVDLHGQTLVYTYQVGHFFGKDENGNPQAAYSDAYALYFNDGTNQIRVVSEYQDAPISREEMLSVAPKEDLARVALAFMDFYTHAWAP